MISAKFHATKKDAFGEKVKLYNRDKRDAEVLVTLFNNTLFQPDRVDQRKIHLFRTWKNGTLRAVLSNRYNIISSLWYMKILSKIIPGGLISHDRSNPDELYTNLLIPDTIRENPDSDFGGMLSLGNSDIGTRTISSLPSVFRAICQNGCIHSQEFGFQLKKRHIGKISLNELAHIIHNNIQKQIPLITAGVDLQINSIHFKMGSTPIFQVMAQICQDYELSVKHMKGIMNAFSVEKNILGNDAFTMFGLVNAITRYGQSLKNNQLWVEFDKLGGNVLSMNDNTWSSFLSRSHQLPSKMVDKLLGISV
jgi:hypothetical protein